VEDFLHEHEHEHEHERTGCGAEGGERGRSAVTVRLWDPSTQLRYRAKRSLPARPRAGR
jgi:hypothetical protein